MRRHTLPLDAAPDHRGRRRFKPASPPARPARRIAAIHRRLRDAYGPRPWKCWGSAVSVLIGTILSQSTSAANSRAGYRQLRRRFPRWEQVARAPVDEIERCIRVSGLSRQKAPRIRAILNRIKADRGGIDLQFLADLDERAALDYLTSLDGVGPKTARCTLLFAFGRGVFPVDTHIHRIAIRLGLIRPGTTAAAAHDLLQPLIPPAARYEMHVLLIAHGRQTCRARNPLCPQCPLADLCPSRRGGFKVRGSGR